MHSYLGFIRRHWALLSFGFVCVFWGNFGQSFFIGWYGDEIKRSLGLSAQTYGAAYSLATLISGLTIMWLGPLIDRWPLRRFVLVVGLGLTAAAIILANTEHVYSLCLGFFCIRLFGQGMLPHAGITTMARYFDRDRGKAISLVTSAVPVGEIVLPLLAVFFIVAVGWQDSWWLVAVSVPMLFAPLVITLLRKAQWKDEFLAEANSGEGQKPLSGRKILLRDARFWMAAPILLAAPFVITAIFIHQDFVLSEKQWSTQWMASSFIVYGVVHWFASVLSGILVDKYSGRQLFKFHVIPLIIALIVVANMQGAWLLILMMILLGTTIGAAGPIIGSMWAEVYGTEILGGVRSAVGAMMVLSTSLSPYFLGWLIDLGVTLQTLFNGLAGFFIVSCGLLKFSYSAKD